MKKILLFIAAGFLITNLYAQEQKITGHQLKGSHLSPAPHPVMRSNYVSPATTGFYNGQLKIQPVMEKCGLILQQVR